MKEAEEEKISDERKKQENYKSKKRRTIDILTESKQEKINHKKLEAAEDKLKQRKAEIEKELWSFRKNPDTFDQNDSLIFGTKKGICNNGTLK